MTTFILLWPLRAALLLRNVYARVVCCNIAVDGINRVRAHPQSQLQFGTKSGADHFRIILPISTKTLQIPANPPTTRKNHRGMGVPRAAAARKALGFITSLRPSRAETRRKPLLRGRLSRLRDVMESIHPHPTLSETVMESAELAYGGATHVAKPRKAAPK